jgi:hypothetical protein
MAAISPSATSNITAQKFSKMKIGNGRPEISVVPRKLPLTARLIALRLDAVQQGESMKQCALPQIRSRKRQAL